MRTLSVSLGILFVFNVVITGCGTQRQHQQRHGHAANGRRATAVPSQNNTCSQCKKRELLKQFRLASIQKQILDKLGFETPPNVTTRQAERPKQIPMLARLIRTGPGIQADQPLRDQPDDEAAIPMEVLTFAKVSPSTPPFGSSVILFTLSSKETTRSNLISAAIWYYVRPSILNRWRRLKITITRIGPRKPGINSYSTKTLLFQYISAQNNRHQGWYSASVTQEVKRWVRRTPSTYGVKFQAHTMGDVLVAAVVTKPLSPGEDANMPFLAMNVQDRRNTRRKRRLMRICTETSTERNCCRYPLTVDFGDLGWDFIIAPRRYEANYCSGECPYKYMQQYPVTTLQQEARGAQVPCCTPTHLSPISMLYYNDKEEIIYGKLQGMVVERCGCS